ncbi:MAG: AMP-binding protein [Paludibacter sp.]|nr:AMP-binding protein [Paludibacter sp.]MDD4198571.1 AMP-binding protein [Paludibacter sp.]MDD4428449.1 AMP-binding protein [Paludibacter sp.]
MHKEIHLQSQTLKSLIENSVHLFPENPSISFVQGQPINYTRLGKEIERVADLLFSYGLKKGDKIALFSHNMPNWVIAFFSVVSKGLVIVPILPDFSAEETKNVLEHSESKVLFVSERLYSRVESFSIPALETIIKLDDFSVIKSNKEQVLTKAPDVNVDETDIASIIYTSGTTGRSKGVMLSHKNMTYVAATSFSVFPINHEDVFLSFLPLSHTYENAIGMLYPIMYGASIFYLEKPPTAAALLPALAKIRPTMMLSVPLIMEKIFKVQVQGKFAKNHFSRMIYKTPLFRVLIHRIAGKKLYRTFGGRLKFFGIGGAKLDARVERFLKEGRMPYAIGYGLTETAPLLAGASPHQTKLHSTGFAIKGVELKIHDPNDKGVGEIWAKGPNVMMGYYKNPEATAEVLVEGGWFRTGDYGRFDRHNRLFIKGRMKNMILSASGENIYPEDIESVLNNNQYVLESLVVEEDGYLVAKVLLDLESLEKHYEHLKSIIEDKKLQYHEWLTNFTKEINEKLNKFSQLKRVDVMHEPFEKTASQKIKRFLYTKKKK